MPTVLRVGKGVKVKEGSRADLPEDLNVRVALIQALIPLGMEAVVELLQQVSNGRRSGTYSGNSG